MVHPGAIEWLKIFEGSNGISNVAESEFDGSVQAAFATRLTSTSCMIKFVSRFSLQAGIYIAGAFAGNFLNGTAFARTAQSSGDMFVAKMNTAGTWCPWCTWCHCGCMRAKEGVLVWMMEPEFSFRTCPQALLNGFTLALPTTAS